MTITEAQAQIDSIESRKAQLVAALAQTGAMLAELESRAGDAFLDGDESIMRDVKDRQIHFDSISAALKALEGRRATAETELQRATAADRRRQASEKRAQLEKLNKETAKLLAKLSELENANFTHSILSSQPRRGAWHSIESGSVTHDVAPWKSVLELDLERSDFGGKISIPLSRKLRMEIEELEQEAQLIERKLPPDPERAIEQVA